MKENIGGKKEAAKMIEEILQHATPKLVVVAVIAIFALVKVTQWVTTELKIRSLGGHAHRVKTWLPGGMSSPLFISTPYAHKYKISTS